MESKSVKVEKNLEVRLKELTLKVILYKLIYFARNKYKNRLNS